MSSKTDFIWINGSMVKWDDAKVHLLTHTLHYGFGVFEGIRCYDTGKTAAVFRLKEHTDRLFNSAKILNLEIPFTEDQVNKAIIETIKLNNLKEGYIRPIVFLGDEARGLNCSSATINLAIALWPWGKYLGEKAINEGIDIKISTFARHHPNIFMTKAKVCGAYVNSVMAKLEAIKDGFDEALMLDPYGFVAEGSGENIFLVKDFKLKTPAAASILDGITRDTVKHIADDIGIEIEEKNISRDELYIADELFFTGTAAEITTIRSLDRRIIGKSKERAITKKIYDAYFEIVHGKNKKYLKWLEFVE